MGEARGELRRGSNSTGSNSTGSISGLTIPAATQVEGASATEGSAHGPTHLHSRPKPHGPTSPGPKTYPHVSPSFLVLGVGLIGVSFGGCTTGMTTIFTQVEGASAMEGFAHAPTHLHSRPGSHWRSIPIPAAIGKAEAPHASPSSIGSA